MRLRALLFVPALLLALLAVPAPAQAGTPPFVFPTAAVTSTAAWSARWCRPRPLRTRAATTSTR
jgi:hypothetical protein